MIKSTTRGAGNIRAFRVGSFLALSLSMAQSRDFPKTILDFRFVLLPPALRFPFDPLASMISKQRAPVCASSVSVPTQFRSPATPKLPRIATLCTRRTASPFDLQATVLAGAMWLHRAPITEWCQQASPALLDRTASLASFGPFPLPGCQFTVCCRCDNCGVQRGRQ